MYKAEQPRQPLILSLRILLFLTGLVLAFIVATSSISYYVAWHLIHPARKSIRFTPADKNLSYHPIHFQSIRDHVILSGWIIPATKSTDKLVIEAHGYHENRSSDIPSLPVAFSLHQAGDSVLLFDFRAEGRSKGKVVTVGLYEQRDLLGAIKYARFLGYRHIGIIGYSMGAATALEVAANDSHIQAVVADSPFASLHRYLVSHMSEWTHLPNWPFTPEIFIELRVFNGLDVRRVDPLKDVKKFRALPVLLIAGTADHIVPMNNSKQLYRAMHRDPEARLWLVSGAKHVAAYRTVPDKYLTRVTNFFESTL